MIKNSVIHFLYSSILICSYFNISYANKLIYPAEIAGRDLNYPPAGWLGHVGITTAPMTSPSGMNQKSNQIIEVLNEPVVGQINDLSNFKSRSADWGTRYGVADRGVGGYNALVEANHQRWWCPAYTASAVHSAGQGIPTTGEIIKCGLWRCDTYALWAFHSAGYYPPYGTVILPSRLFKAFPYANNAVISEQNEINVPIMYPSKSLNEYSIAELNAMSFEEFELVADIPLDQESPEHINAEMRLVRDEQLDSQKRGIFIDRLTIGGKYPNSVSQFITLYNHTQDKEVKSKIIQGLMIYYQQHLDLAQNNNEHQLLVHFYSQLLDTDINNQNADHTIRSYIDLNNAEDVLINQHKIDTLLTKVPHQSSIMLKNTLVKKSKRLEKIYIPSIIKELKEANDYDVDSYFFGPLNLTLQINKANLEPESKKMVLIFLNELQTKYSKEAINKNNGHAAFTAPLYFQLLNRLNSN